MVQSGKMYRLVQDTTLFVCEAVSTVRGQSGKMECRVEDGLGSILYVCVVCVYGKGPEGQNGM